MKAKFLLTIWAPLAFLVMFTMTALAQVAEPVQVDQAVGLLPQILADITGQKYLLAGALITLVLVFIIKQYALPKLNLSTAVLPLASAVIGVISGYAVSIAGGATAGQAAVALLSGPAASALWDVLLKYLFPVPAAPAALK